LPRGARRANGREGFKKPLLTRKKDRRRPKVEWGLEEKLRTKAQKLSELCKNFFLKREKRGTKENESHTSKPRLKERRTGEEKREPQKSRVCS